MANQTLNFTADPYTDAANPGTPQTQPAGTGAAGADGTYSYDSSNCKYNCSGSPKNGDPGNTGLSGNKGNDGATGLPGPISTWTLGDIVGDLTINAGGGNGQDAGAGGNGQAGGPGGPAGRLNPNNVSPINSACTAASQGPQGVGGKGGLGGKAGDGGTGANVIIYYNSLSGNASTNVSSGKPGNPGTGGPPGGGPTNLGPGDNGGTGSPGSVSKINLIPLS